MVFHNKNLGILLWLMRLSSIHILYVNFVSDAATCHFWGTVNLHLSAFFFFFCILLILCGNLLLINGPWKYWWHHRFLGFSQVLIQTEAFLPAGRRKMHRSSTNLSLEYFSTSGSNKTHNLLLWLRCVVQLCLSAL